MRRAACGVWHVVCWLGYRSLSITPVVRLPGRCREHPNPLLPTSPLHEPRSPPYLSIPLFAKVPMAADKVGGSQQSGDVKATLHDRLNAKFFAMNNPPSQTQKFTSAAKDNSLAVTTIFGKTFDVIDSAEFQPSASQSRIIPSLPLLKIRLAQKLVLRCVLLSDPTIGSQHLWSQPKKRLESRIRRCLSHCVYE